MALRGIGAGVVVGVLVFGVDSAAALRIASPVGINTGDCIAEPCNLTRAVDVAEQNSDDVLVRRGAYTLTQTLDVGAIDVAGDQRFPMPSIATEQPDGTPGIKVTNGGTLTYLRVTSSADGGGGLIAPAVEVGKFSDLYQIDARAIGPDFTAAIRATDAGQGIGAATIRNSAAFNTGDTCAALRADDGVDVVLRNVTAYSTSTICEPLSLWEGSTVNARNVIVANPARKVDIRVLDGSTLDLDYASFGHHADCAPPNEEQCVQDEGTLTLGSHLQTTPALAPDFADAAAGNLHQLGTSPTLNQGLNSAADGLDLDGDQRIVGGGIVPFVDIGADERTPGPGASLDAFDPGPTTATVTGAVDPNSGHTRWRMDVGTDPPPTLFCAFLQLYFCASVGNSSSPVAVTRELEGLEPDTTYFVRIRAENAAGFAAELGMFTTDPLLCGGKAATQFGSPGPDKIVGTTGADVIAALAGNDKVKGGGGKDVICGGAGRDRLIGGRGADRLRGEAGRDRLRGGKGRDRCHGGPARDRAESCEKQRQI